MDSLVAAVRNFTEDEAGITAIEYGLIAALVAVAVAAAMVPLKDGLVEVFTDLKGKLNIP